MSLLLKYLHCFKLLSLAYIHVNGSTDHEDKEKNWSNSGTNSESSWTSNILFIGKYKAFDDNDETEAIRQ